MGSPRRQPFVLLVALVAAGLAFGVAGRRGADEPVHPRPGHAVPLLAPSDWGQEQAALGARSDLETFGSGASSAGGRFVARPGDAGWVSAGAGGCRTARDRAGHSGRPASCRGAHLRSPPG